MLQLEKPEIKKILIIRLSAIGDVVHCLSVLRLLRLNFPQAQIDWAVDQLAAPLLEGHPYLQQIKLIPSRSLEKKLKKPATLFSGLQEVKEIKKDLQKEKYDLVLDLHGLLKSGLVSYFTQAPVRLVYPLARDFSYLFATHRVPQISPSPHVIEKYLDVARYLGLEIDKVKFPLGLGKKEKEFVQRFLYACKEKKLLFALNPGASRLNKQWPPEKFSQLGDSLIQKYDCQILLLGSPDELALVKKVASQMKKQPLIAAGKTSLRELAALLQECHLFIAGDTGPLQLAVAVDIPVIAIFGPTDYQYSGPYSQKKVIISRHLPCSPCFAKGTCAQGTACIKEITIEQVLQGVKELEPFFRKALPALTSKP